MSDIDRLQTKLALALVDWLMALAKQAREDADLDAEMREAIMREAQ